MSVAFQSATLATPASGTTVATDSVASVHYQYVKLADPTAASTTGFGISGNPIYVQFASAQSVSISGTPTVTVSGTVTTSVSGTVTVDSELPAAAAASDAFANPTAPGVLSFSMGWNGTTWDRLKSTTANGLAVDVTRVTGTVTTSVSGTVTVDSELPAAAALTDAFANPTAPGVASFSMGWNGTTWDRLKSTTANGLVVDVSRVQGTVTTSVSGTVTVDSELSAAAALADATANPTVTSVGAFLQGYNGTTWDRLRSTTANGLVVDVSRVQGTTSVSWSGQSVSVTGTVTVDSELPAAAALADATANPTTTSVAGFIMGWNGATWDRLKSSTANGLQVDVTRVTGTVTVDSELPAAAALADAASNPTAPAVGAFIMGWNGATWDRLKSTTANGLAVDVTRVQGTVTANSTLQTGSNLAGRINPEPQTANGLSISRVISAATTNATSVKASAGQVYSIYATNVNAAARFLKLYNKATAPTVGTDTPVLTFAIPGNAAGAGFSFDTGGMGVAFGTGIGLAITAAVTDADTTAVAANEIVVNLLYK